MKYPFDLDVRPDGYAPLECEPVFDPNVHLALEKPTDVYSLHDLGYDPEEVAQCPTEFAATSVFRVLSDEGAACLLDVCRQLEAFTSSNPRILRCTRGGVYRSKFLRDLCLSIEVAEFLSGIVGMDMMPHTISHQLGHLNYAPPTVGEDVDKWHVDTLRFDYVMFVTDPTKVKGGAFQYFKGTKHEMQGFKDRGEGVPHARVIAPEMPGPGYAILQQGNMVVHQAKGLLEPGERITMVNGYIAADPNVPDYTRYDQLVFADPPHVVTPEYVRHVSYMAERALKVDTGFQPDRDVAASRLQIVSDLLANTAEQLRNVDQAKMEHF
ncbi:MAG: hypothetical protein ACPGRD_05990 [Planktomarina sp.]